MCRRLHAYIPFKAQPISISIMHIQETGTIKYAATDIIHYWLPNKLSTVVPRNRTPPEHVNCSTAYWYKNTHNSQVTNNNNWLLFLAPNTLCNATSRNRNSNTKGQDKIHGRSMPMTAPILHLLPRTQSNTRQCKGRVLVILVSASSERGERENIVPLRPHRTWHWIVIAGTCKINKN